MHPILILAAVALLALSIVSLLALGLCLGMAHLMVYFVPALGLADTLAPAAILTTTVIIMLASAFKAVFLAGINNMGMPSYGNDGDDEENGEDGEEKGRAPAADDDGVGAVADGDAGARRGGDVAVLDAQPARVHVHAVIAVLAL